MRNFVDDELLVGVVQVSFEYPGQKLFVENFVTVMEHKLVSLTNPCNATQGSSEKVMNKNTFGKWGLQHHLRC